MNAGTGTAARLAIADPRSGEWNRLDADVDVTVESGGSPEMRKRKASRGMTYHLTRRRDASGGWVSDLGFEELSARTPGQAAPARPPQPKRIRGTSANAPGIVLDAQGRPITLRIPSSAETPINTGEQLARVPRNRPMPPAGIGAQRAPTDTSRRWAQIYFPTPEGADLATESTDEVEDLPGNRRRVRRQRGDVITEVTVNRGTGAVEETRVRQRGRLRSESSRHYELDQNGVLTLRSERMVHHLGDGAAPGVITVSYRNIRLSKEQ